MNYKKNKTKVKEIKLSIKKYILSFLYRTMICIILVLSCFILLKMNKFTKKDIEHYLYHEQLNFSYFKKLYNKYIGEVFPLESFITTSKVFSEKLTYQKSEKYNLGGKLYVDDNYLVPSLESGIVVYIGNKDEYGDVVIVQQTNGIDTWYGNVESSLSMYDYVEKGELIGSSKNNYIYLVFEKEGKFLNYKDYI